MKVVGGDGTRRHRLLICSLATFTISTNSNFLITPTPTKSHTAITIFVLFTEASDAVYAYKTPRTQKNPGSSFSSGVRKHLLFPPHRWRLILSILEEQVRRKGASAAAL